MEEISRSLAIAPYYHGVFLCHNYEIWRKSATVSFKLSQISRYSISGRFSFRFHWNCTSDADMLGIVKRARLCYVITCASL